MSTQNHPLNIIKALPNSISQQISNISSDKAKFNNAAPSSNDALSASECKENLTDEQALTPAEKVKTKKDNMV